MSSDAMFVCPVCGELADEFSPGPAARPRARCAACGSLERHRFLALLLGCVAPASAQESMVLDVAPSRQISSVIRAINPDGYCSIDFDPDADGRIVDIVASLTDLPFEDDSVGLLVCYHVLEHIPDDRLAMREIARVLRPDGVALIQVPWRDGMLTDEDVDTTPEERLRRFGQADHVRYYGTDFVPRLQEEGLVVSHMQSRDVADPSLMAALGVLPDEHIWFATVEEKALPDLDAIREGIQAWLASTIARATRTAADEAKGQGVEHWKAQAETARARLTGSRAEVERQKAIAAKWRNRYKTLRGQWPVRVMVGLSRPFRSKR